MPFAHNGQISPDPIEGGIEITDAQYDAALDGMQTGLIVSIEGGFFVEAPPTPEEEEPPAPTQQEIINAKIKLFDQRIKERLDKMARTMRFDSISGAVAAAGLPVGEYRQDDGAKLHLWSARTWQKGEEILIAFLSGQRDEPTWEEVEAELPAYPIAA